MMSNPELKQHLSADLNDPPEDVSAVPGLYRVYYEGVDRKNRGALFEDGQAIVFMGHGAVLGVDITNIYYKGIYKQVAGDRIRLEINMTATETAVQLVTGQPVFAGQKLQLTADWPLDFSQGNPQEILIDGHPVKVACKKVVTRSAP